MRLSKFILAHVRQFHHHFPVLYSSQNYLRPEIFPSISSRQFHRSQSVVLSKAEKRELLVKQRAAVGLPEPISTREQEENERRKREEREQQERMERLHESDQDRRYRKEQKKAEWRQKYQMSSSALQTEYFEEIKDKNKDTFLAAVEFFSTRDKYLRGHCEFIQAALRMMRQFGVHKDLDCYKKLIDVFPKGKMVATSIWQVEFMHYPKQQNCALEILCQMEKYQVQPDSDIEELFAVIFGRRSFPSRKHYRMMYWMPKFKYLTPFPLPDPLPWDALELVNLAIKQITTVDLQTSITIYQAADLEDAIDHTWIVSGQSPDQQALIETHPSDRPIYVEGAFRVWLFDQCVNYFILRSEPKAQPEVEKIDPDDVGDLHHILQEDYKDVMLKPSVHEQDDGVILAVCGTGTSSKDSLVSWINFLKDTNPRLGKDISVLFTLKSPIGPTDDLEPLTDEKQRDKEAIGDMKDTGLVGIGLGFDPKRPKLSQVGVNPLSDTRFVNWPHHYNRTAELYEEDEQEKISPPDKEAARLKWEQAIEIGKIKP